ncbi:MAG: hypothetical protein OQL08_10580 [Gammaproteobacteria bacterium]|nr:hypothetical protein [Gammaproteobacteria bacterium]
MEQILEIRDGCSTPEQLLKSRAFSRYIRIYKKEFMDELGSRSGVTQKEAHQRSDFIKGLSARDFIAVLNREEHPGTETLEHDRSVVRFLDGAFHHFRGTGYSRLVRLQNEVMLAEGETPETVKDKVTAKAGALADLLLETRRQLLRKAGMDSGVRRSYGLDPSPNVTSGEISGHYLNLPGSYHALAHVPLTIAADIRTGVDYTTPSNKRAYPFYELDHNPLDLDTFEPDDWVSVPLQVGAYLIVAYLHKSRGCIEMEPGLLNLFPFANIREIIAERRPDGVFIFGDPHAGFGPQGSSENELGYYYDKENDLLVGLVPNRDELKYFGYCKKPILTLHNVLAIRDGDLPLHCGATRYLMRFDIQSGEPYIEEMIIKADDMGRVRLETDGNGITRPVFYGTETGAFACLDGFSEAAKLQMIGREVGYNKETGSNARQIIPVSTDEEMQRGDPLDILLYMNNFELVEEGKSTIQRDLNVDQAVAAFRLGERVAAGSTHTHRGAKEASFWANPFPLLRELNGEEHTILHPELYEKFTKIEERFISVFRQLTASHEMTLGIAHSQLMAGVYEGNSDAALARCGYHDRDEVEMKAPKRLAEDLIELIKEHAQVKRARLGAGVNEVSITVALVGDSRTGKSETAEKMEGVLNLQGV